MGKFVTWRWQKGRARRMPHIEADNVLGIACTGHGASLAYLNRDGVVRSSVLDRWTGVKYSMMFSADEDQALRHPTNRIDQGIHDMFCYGYGKFPETRVFENSLMPWLEWLLRDLPTRAADMDLVVTSDSHFGTNWRRLGLELDRWFPSAAIWRDIEHHEIHQRQAFWQSGFDQAAVVTLDTCGEGLLRLRGKKLAGTISAMDKHGRCQVLTELLFPEGSAGNLYSVTTFHCGFRQDEEGKTMGLAPYGSPELYEQLRPHLHLRADGSFRFLRPDDYTAALSRYVPSRRPGEELTQRHMDVAYAGQVILDEIITNAWQAALRLTGLRRLAYAGGVALNSTANDKACKAVQPDQVYIATNPGDTGQALGCAMFGAYELAGWPPPQDELHEYLGPPYSSVEIEDATRASTGLVSRPADLDRVLARCIANGHIVARFDGPAEFGPRALGNRSILSDPRRPDMKDYLNARVKHREGFRPFAPTVLIEHVADWFELQGRSAYMLRVVPVRDDRRDQVPAIVHVDGTARVQTVSRDENPGYWSLVQAFHEQTGVPLVLNTSFNVAGKPIVETPRDAVDCFEGTDIDLLALGPYVISKQPLDALQSHSR